MTQRKHGSIVMLAIAWGVMAMSSAAYAQDEAFKKGLEARSQRRWADAADQMRKAAEADNRESTRKVRGGFLGAFGGGGTEYLPYYFLGEALNHLGDCGGAVTAWEISVDQKAVTSQSDLMGAMRVGFRACEVKGVLLRGPYLEQLAAAEQRSRDVTQIVDQLARVRTSSPSLWQSDVGPVHERVRREVDAMANRLDQARRSRMPADFTAVNDMAARIGEMLKPIQARVSAVVEQQLQPAVSSVDREFAFAQNLLGQVDRLSAERPAANRPELTARRRSLQQEITGTRQRFDAARRSGDVSGVLEAGRQATATRLRLDALIKAYGPVTLRDRGVAEALETGVRHYFAGEYKEAVDALGAGALANVPLQVHVHLFRAAALHALFLLSGGTDQALQSNAVAEVVRCKTIDPAFQPDARAFSPRFVQFFQATAMPTGPGASGGTQ